jgi:hypothetical protein
METQNSQPSQNTLDDLAGPTCRRNIFGNVLFLSEGDSSSSSQENNEKEASLNLNPLAKTDDDDEASFDNSLKLPRKKVLNKNSNRRFVISPSTSEDEEQEKVNLKQLHDFAKRVDS